MLFRLENVHKFYGAEEVLRGATLQVNPEERVGLVGRNGAGKTTVFRLVTGAEEADRGQVFLAKGIRLGILEQQPAFSGLATVREEALSVFAGLQSMETEMQRLEHSMGSLEGRALDEAMHAYSDLRHAYETSGGFVYHSKCDAVLYGLGFTTEDLDRPAELLSGGQKSRLTLARLLLGEPDLLLLDEPTNHLDVGAVEWLESFLAEYRSAFVVISHDRYLLDRVSNRIIELEGGRAAAFSGNYSAYVRQREERRLAQAREYEQQQQLISRTEDFIRRNIAGQKTKQARSRRNMLERLERIDPVKQEGVLNFDTGEVVRASDIVLRVDRLSVGYGANVLAREMSAMLRRTERLGIVGPNGTGKTTFLRTLAGRIEPLRGTFAWGANVSVGFFDQEQRNLDPAATVIEDMSSAAPGATEGVLRNYLARFLFTDDEVFKTVATLSGGEKSRLALAKLISSRANVLLLDEPTNHLDIPSREALERALASYPGTIIAVSHDRYFLDRIATEILYFNGATAIHHMGSYTEFHEGIGSRPVEARRARRKKEAPSSLAGAPGNIRKVDKIEADIARLEGELSSLAEQLSNPPSDWVHDDYSRAHERQESLAAQLEKLYEEWESASAGL